MHCEDDRSPRGFGMTMLRRCGVAITMAAVGGALGACSYMRSGTAQSAGEDPFEFHGAIIPVEVQNDNMQDLNIFVLHGGSRTRIGIAGAAQKTNFNFPAHYSAGAATVRLAAVPLIGGRFGWRKSILSEAINVHGGERVVFSLESDLARSTIAIYAMVIRDPADTVPPPTDSSIADLAPASAGFLRYHRR